VQDYMEAYLLQSKDDGIDTLRHGRKPDGIEYECMQKTIRSSTLFTINPEILPKSRSVSTSSLEHHLQMLRTRFR
jgi:hypothetical protein